MQILDEQTALILCFTGGVALQAVVLMRGSWNWGKFGLCAVIGLLGFVPGRHESQYEPTVHALICIGLFSFSFASSFKDQILPVITDKILLSYTLVFWFAFFTYYFNGTKADLIILVLLLVPSLATVLVAFFRPKLGFAGKLVLYGWFLTTLVCIGLFQFPFRHLTLFLSGHNPPWLTPADALVSGMAFLYLAVNLAYIYLLIPIPARSQSFENRMQEWHQLTDQMTHRVLDDNPSRQQVILLVLLEGGALLLIHLFHWVPEALAINALVILPGLLILRPGSRLAQAVAADEYAAHGYSTAMIGRNDPCPCGSGKKYKHCHGSNTAS